MTRPGLLLTALCVVSASSAGCGMFAFNRQVVVNPATVDDFRSPAWVVDSPPAGGKVFTEEADD